MGTESLFEYRAAKDAAVGAKLCLELKPIIDGAHAQGEISSEAACEAWGYIDEALAKTGTNVRALERKADRMRGALVQEHWGLVKKVTKRVLGERARVEANLEEALQEASIGLLRAIDEFDPNRGSFATCAAVWIRHHVQTCMHFQVDFAKQRSACMPAPIVRLVNRFRLLNGRDPQPEEVGATRADWDRWNEGALAISVEDLSASRDRLEDDSMAFQLEDETTDPNRVSVALNLRDRIEECLSEMSPRNRELLLGIFVDGKSIDEVAEQYGISRTRIHQLRQSIEKKLRDVLHAA